MRKIVPTQDYVLLEKSKVADTITQGGIVLAPSAVPFKVGHLIAAGEECEDSIKDAVGRTVLYLETNEVPIEGDVVLVRQRCIIGSYAGESGAV